MLKHEDIQWIGVRFQDPVGRVFLYKGQYYRAVYPRAAQYVRHMLESGIIGELSEKGLHIGMQQSDLSLDGFELVLSSDTSIFNTRLHTASRQQLKKAALNYIDANIILHKHNFGMLDGHKGNFVQTKYANPVWCDLGSIVPLTGDEMAGIEEFVRCIVRPLVVMARGERLARIGRLLLKDGGLDDSELRQLSRISIQYPANRLDALTSLRELLESLSFPEAKTTWSAYHSREKLNLDERKAKAYTNPNIQSQRDTIITRFIKRFQPRSIIDAGCNAGAFSLLSANLTQEVFGFDMDEQAIDRLYNEITTRRIPNIRIAVDNVLIPENENTAELVLALALTHHLRLGARYPFDYIAEKLASHTTNALITEFMPNGLGGTRPNPDPLPGDYRLEVFTSALGRHFHHVEVIDYPLPENHSKRILVICWDRGLTTEAM